MTENDVSAQESVAAERREPPPVWRLAFCWKDEARPVNVPEDAGSLARRFQEICRRTGAVCLADILALPPERGLRSLLKPIPREQPLLSSVWTPEAFVAEMAHTTPVPEDLCLASIRQELVRREHVLFWVPGPAIPSVAQTEERLARIREMGGNPLVSTLALAPIEPPPSWDPFDHPATAEMHRHEERIGQDPRYASLQYDRRCFLSVANSANGDVQPGLRFDYHQEDLQIWAWYEGDGVFLGSLVARKSPEGWLRMAYQHVNAKNEARMGQCLSYPEFLPGGRLRMHEFWRWSNGDGSTGISQIEECEGTTIPRKWA